MVHERVHVEGRCGHLNGDLMHDPYRDLSEQLCSIDRYARLFVLDAKQSGRRAHVWDVLLRPLVHLVKALVVRRGILDGIRGWCLAGLGASAVMLKWGLLYLDERAK